MAKKKEEIKDTFDTAKAAHGADNGEDLKTLEKGDEQNA